MAGLSRFVRTLKTSKKLLIPIILIYLIYVFYLLTYHNKKLYKSNFVKDDSNLIKPKKSFIDKKNWIVITSVNEPTDQVKNLARINNFQLLVVGDKKTNQNWKYKNVIFLNIKEQSNLNFKSFHTNAFNSYTRKNIGYLYAIENGARYIYDTDDDNEPLVNLTQYFNLNKYDYGLIIECNSQKVVNPYAHFGQPLIWPRGFPLNEIKKNHYNNYICGRRKTSYVQQGVVNGDPDVDAIFRLTKTMEYKKINIKFDETSPSIQYPIYKMTPYNSQNTFFHYEAFWSLYLPKTVTFRLTDIWRSYWAQRLMWLLNDTITYNGPNAYQLRNSHSYLKDFEQEKSMYSNTERLIDFLFKWKCLKLKFYECVIDLSYQMAIQKFWEMEEVESIRNWLNDLDNIGYIEPKIINFENNDIHLKTKCHNLKYNENDIQYFPVRYSPKFQKSIDLDNYCCDGRIEEIYDNFQSIKYLQDFCSLSNATLKMNPFKIITKKNTQKQSNITLLITFNSFIYVKSIELIKHLYGDYFENIVYCGKDILNVLNSSKSSFKKFDSYSFIDINVGWAGSSHYYCMTKAIEMNFMTEGILLMSDDVLLKYWHLVKYDVKKIWYPFKLECKQELVINSTINGWVHWNRASLNGLLNVWKEFDKIISGLIPAEKEQIKMIKSFMNMLAYNSRNTTGIFKDSNHTKVCASYGSDIFYLPKSYFKKFHSISNIFRKYNIHLEIAVPSLLAGLEANINFEILNGNYFWNVLNFEFSYMNYEKTGIFFHPCKLSGLISSNEGKLYCEKFIQEKINNINYH